MVESLVETNYSFWNIGLHGHLKTVKALEVMSIRDVWKDNIGFPYGILSRAIVSHKFFEYFKHLIQRMYE